MDCILQSMRQHPLAWLLACLGLTVWAHASWVTTSFMVHYYSVLRAKGERARLRVYAGAIVREWCAVAVTACLYPLGLLPARPFTTWEPHGGPPVVLVHGYLMNRACLFVLAWRLRRRGLRNVYLMDLQSMWGSIESVAHTLARRIDELAVVCGGTPPVAVGHSMGGLVLRWCAQANPQLPLRKIVCLASPHQGTLTALLAVGRNGMQLRPKSPFFAALGEAAGVPVVSIYSTLDNIVLPAISAAFGTRTVRFENLGHASVLYNEGVFLAIWREIVDAP